MEKSATTRSYAKSTPREGTEKKKKKRKKRKSSHEPISEEAEGDGADEAPCRSVVLELPNWLRRQRFFLLAKEGSCRGLKLGRGGGGGGPGRIVPGGCWSSLQRRRERLLPLWVALIGHVWNVIGSVVPLCWWVKSRRGMGRGRGALVETPDGGGRMVTTQH